MAVDCDDDVPRLVRSIAAPLVLIFVSAGLMIWATTFGETARQVPLLVAGTMLVLSAIDLVSRFDIAALQPLRDFWGADFDNREMRHNPRWSDELTLFAWMIGCVAGMLLIGFLPAVPAFVFSYMLFNGRRPIVESTITAALVFAFVYVVFEILLQYQLYRGALFDGRGFASW